MKDDIFEERDLFGEIPRSAVIDSVLKDKFIMPPFSVLSARDGAWQERKRKWLALGIQSEVGRGDVMPSGASNFGRCFGQDLMRGEHVIGGRHD